MRRSRLEVRMISYRAIAQIFEDLETALFASLKRNLASHIEQEKQTGFDWSAWQAEKLINLGKFREKNEKLLGDYLPEIDEGTRQLLEEQYAEGERRAEKELEALKAENAPSVSGSVGGFHGVNEPRLEKLLEDTRQLEHTAENAALRMMDDVYRTTLHRAEIAMASGSVTLPQAIDMSVKEFLRKGINCIEYKDGRRVNIADYAEMALRSAATRSQMQGLSDRFNAMGYDTVLITEYGQCSDTCLPWQGRVYINDVWGQYPLPGQPDKNASKDTLNTLDNSGKSDIIKAGGYSGAKKTEGWRGRHGEQMYEEIRHRSTDVKHISESTPFKESAVEEIKQHMFFKEHKFADGTMKRFDSSFEQAQAWDRLSQGKGTATDLILLKHEYVELTQMRLHGYDYETAHARANEKYDWAKKLKKETE